MAHLEFLCIAQTNLQKCVRAEGGTPLFVPGRLKVQDSLSTQKILEGSRGLSTVYKLHD